MAKPSLMAATFYRKELTGVVAIRTATQLIEVALGQSFYETPKAVELWQKEPLRRLKRWPTHRVFWYINRETDSFSV